MLKIEVGKHYRTRDGRKAFVERSTPDIRRYPIHGFIQETPTSWQFDGKFDRSNDNHPLDLVAEWVEPQAESKPPALTLVQEERARQVAKGYTPEHDDQHTNSELISAAFTFVLLQKRIHESTFQAARMWPFEEPPRLDDTPVRNLVKAAACLVAEIERRQRRGE